jgi:hypothetical protein
MVLHTVIQSKYLRKEMALIMMHNKIITWL